MARRILGIFVIAKAETAEAPHVSGSRASSEVMAALSCGSPLENRVLVLPPLPTHLRSGLADLLSSYTASQLACFVLILAPGAVFSLAQRVAPGVFTTDLPMLVLARGVSRAQEARALVPAPLTQWVGEAVLSLPGPGTPHWPTWGWLGYYATAPRRVDAARPTHLASELEVFWTGRGGSFALSFLALSLSARLILVVVLVGIL